MTTFVMFIEVEHSGRPKGHILLNVDKIIHIRERNLPLFQKGCVITTSELSVDCVSAAEHNVTASYSDSVLVGGSMAQVISVMKNEGYKYPDWAAAGLIDDKIKRARQP